MTISRSTDYQTIRELLIDPRCWRRMTTSVPQGFEVGPRENVEYVLVKEGDEALAVFVIVKGMEIHFCFSPEVWGRTLTVAKAFIEWAWENLDAPVLIGPVPVRNRLALRLAKKAGFKESHFTDRENLIYTYLERPAA